MSTLFTTFQSEFYLKVPRFSSLQNLHGVVPIRVKFRITTSKVPQFPSFQNLHGVVPIWVKFRITTSRAYSVFFPQYLDLSLSLHLPLSNGLITHKKKKKRSSPPVKSTGGYKRQSFRSSNHELTFPI